MIRSKGVGDMAYTQGLKKGTSKREFDEYMEKTFPQDKLAPFRNHEPLEEQATKLIIALTRLKVRCAEDLVVGAMAEKWGDALRQVNNLRQIYTLEWQIAMRNKGK